MDGQFVLLVRKADLRIEMGDLVAEFDGHRLAADLRLLRYKWQGSLKLGDRGCNLVGFSDLLRDLLVQSGDLIFLRRGLLDHRGAGSGDVRGRRFRWRHKGGAQISAGLPSGPQRRQSGDVQFRNQQIVGHMIALGRGDGLIEPHHDLACRHVVAIVDQDRRHNAGVQRLDGLGPSGWDHLSRRSGDDVDASENGPAQGDDEKQNDREGDRASARRGRCFHDLQRRRQELELRTPGNSVGAPQPHNIILSLRRLHKYLPASDADRHIARWS